MGENEQLTGISQEGDKKPSVVWKSDTHRIVRWWRYENIMEGIQESGWAYGLEAAQPKDMMGNEAWLRIKFKDSQVEFSGYEWSQIVGALMQGIVDLSEPDVTHGWTEFY